MAAFGRKPTVETANRPSNAYQLEAMINVLERKGILTAKEVMDELEEIVATEGKNEGWLRGLYTKCVSNWNRLLVRIRLIKETVRKNILFQNLHYDCYIQIQTWHWWNR